MCSKINWWQQERISWYERASRYSSFHSSLSSFLSSMIDRNDEIIEAGCGLGYLTNSLYQLGYENIKGYDIDSDAIDFAKKHFKRDLFCNEDIFSQKKKVDVLICVFFGKLSRNDNYENFKKIANKKIIYVTGGGSARHVSPEEISSFLDSRSAKYNKTTLILPFHQPFLNMEEANSFLLSYYKDEIREIKRKAIKPCDIGSYPLMLENNKEITIFEITIGGNK